MRILLTIHHPIQKNSAAAGSLWRLAQQYRALGREVETFSLVVPRRAIRAIVAAFERLLGDETLYQNLRENAQQTAQSYTWDAVARARLELYDQIRDSRANGDKSGGKT